jgi:hypothetical protein
VADQLAEDLAIGCLVVEGLAIGYWGVVEQRLLMLASLAIGRSLLRLRRLNKLFSTFLFDGSLNTEELSDSVYFYSDSI